MTEKQAKSLARHALPCPFCDLRLVVHSDQHGCWVAHKDEPGSCEGSTVQLLDEADLARWNTREGTLHTPKRERTLAQQPWQPLPRKDLERILADTVQDAPACDFTADDVYRLAREVLEYRGEHIRRVRRMLEKRTA